MPIKGTKQPLALRIVSKFTIDIATQCWNWNGSRSSQYRYPTIASEENGKTPLYAYRAMWEDANGSIPAGPAPDGSWRYEMHHRCENKACINPAHVMLVTSKEHAAIHKDLRSAAKMKVAA
jgi:hypothetical protein